MSSTTTKATFASEPDNYSRNLVVQLYNDAGHNYEMMCTNTGITLREFINGAWSKVWDSVIKSDLRNIVTSRIFETGGKVTVPVGSEITADIPFTIPDGYKFLCINDSWVNGSYVIVSNRYRSGNSVKVVLRTYASNPITANVYADILFVLE